MSSTGAEHLRVIEGEGRAPSAPPDDPLIGRTIDGRYAIESHLGEGGMGLVYRARHTVLGKPLAVKVLRPDVSKDQEIMTRFRLEAQSASNIGNQHIIDISDFGVLPDGSTYFVMEYLDGVDLTKVVEADAPINPQRVVHVASQLCEALGAAHEIGIVHRDLKPDNIYLVPKGGDRDFVKVLDFGIAKVGGSASKLTKAGQVFGTPHYMSPEQCAGKGVDHRTDIYALGVIMYEMVTGKLPFDADNLMGILTKHLYEAPVKPSDVVGPQLVPPDLEAIILRCLTKNADKRYQTMAELRQDLERLNAGVPVQASTSAALAAATLPAIAEPDRSGRGKTWLAAGLGVVLALGGVGAGIFALTAEDTPSPPTPVAQPTPEPEAPPAEAQAGAPEAPPQPRETTIESDPPGAEVFRGADVLIGVTPVTISRPDRTEEPYEFELRLDGYEPRAIRISHLTQAEVRITLDPTRPARGERAERGRPTRPAERDRPTATAPAMEAPAAPTMMAPAMAEPTSEVLDPWATD